MTDRTKLAKLSAHLPLVAVIVLLAGTVLVALRFGVPAAVLWLAFAALTGAVLLFWESLRVALDPSAQLEEISENVTQGMQADLEGRKAAALRALKDLAFERSLGRITDEDHAQLTERYRAEARSAMAAMDDDLGAFLPEAEALFDKAARGEHAVADDAAIDGPRNRKRVAAVSGDASAASRSACSQCSADNEPDAVFCKKCGARVAEGAES